MLVGRVVRVRTRRRRIRPRQYCGAVFLHTRQEVVIELLELRVVLLLRPLDGVIIGVGGLG